MPAKLAEKLAPRKTSGFVLIIVLWLIALLTIMAMGLAYNSRQSVRSMASLVGGTQARYLAEGGVQMVLMNLLSGESYDRLLGDGETIVLDIPGGVVAVTVVDEAGKVDLNGASAELLMRLFASFELPDEEAESLADAVVDYRDADHLLSLNGAEDAQYLAAGLPWEAKDSAFTGLDELQQVYGMPRWLYKALLPYVTIHGRGKGVNPQLAPLQVLMALSDDSLGSLQTYIEDRRDNHQAGLAMPPSPAIDRQFLSQTRGLTFSISSVGTTQSNQQSAITTVLRLRRGRNRELVETLSWLPYRLGTVSADAEHDSLGNSRINPAAGQ